MSVLDRERLHRAVTRVNQELLAAIGPDGHWVGELSSSALSTAREATNSAGGPITTEISHAAAHQTLPIPVALRSNN